MAFQGLGLRWRRGLTLEMSPLSPSHDAILITLLYFSGFTIIKSDLQLTTSGTGVTLVKADQPKSKGSVTGIWRRLAKFVLQPIYLFTNYFWGRFNTNARSKSGKSSLCLSEVQENILKNVSLPIFSRCLTQFSQVRERFSVHFDWRFWAKPQIFTISIPFNTLSDKRSPNA